MTDEMVKRFIYLFLFAVFIVFSCFFFNSAYRTRAHMAELDQNMTVLKKITVMEDNTERTDYLDDNGNITMAQNLGYATVIISITDYGRVESYFDEHGNPVAGRDGYASAIYVYNEEDNKTHVYYIGKNREPVTVRNGYAEEVREYNQRGQMTVVRYYDVYGQPAQFTYFGYGKKIEYDENGKQSQVTYVDSFGEPMMTQEGYATIKRVYYLSDGPEYDKVKYEFYFGITGKPISLPLGQYGLYYEYDEYGRPYMLTYLDADGQPIIINRGYAKVRRSFSDNNQILEERYYDQYGNPCALAEGQYGFRWENGKKIYLDKNGSDQLSLKNILYTHSWLVILIAIAVLILSVKSNRNMNVCLLIICLLTVFYMTLMNRNNITTQSGIDLFSSLWRMIFDRETRVNVLRNIWLFVPMGAILYSLCSRKKILLVPAALSIIIEVIQHLLGIGYCDVGDVVSNSIGAMFGFMIANVITDVRPKC